VVGQFPGVVDLGHLPATFDPPDLDPGNASRFGDSRLRFITKAAP
jgi:hypothetical protein